MKLLLFLLIFIKFSYSSETEILNALKLQNRESLKNQFCQLCYHICKNVEVIIDLRSSYMDLKKPDSPYTDEQDRINYANYVNDRDEILSQVQRLLKEANDLSLKIEMIFPVISNNIGVLAIYRMTKGLSRNPSKKQLQVVFEFLKIFQTSVKPTINLLDKLEYQQLTQ